MASRFPWITVSTLETILSNLLPNKSIAFDAPSTKPLTLRHSPRTLTVIPICEAGPHDDASGPVSLDFPQERREARLGFQRGVILAILRHPILLVEAVRSWFAMRRRGGFGPAGPYLGWRRATAYGDSLTTMSAHDVVNYLSWRREMRSIRKWEREA